MKAIQTRYRGYHFRSRLEARWAVFFDALGIKWEYEPEGFELPNGERYLPDFHSPLCGSGGTFTEIKPCEPSAIDVRKLETLCEMTSSYGLLIYGPPGSESVLVVHKEGVTISEYLYDKRWYDGSLEHASDNERSDAEHWLAEGMLTEKTKRVAGEIENIQYAVNAARSARFEFGEKGAT